jgi:hypothetical protein
MQNAFVIHDPLAPDDPCSWIAMPFVVNIWTNDQNLKWKIIDPSGKVTWADPPFDFSQSDWVKDGGTLPVREENPKPGAQPFYVATGPGARDVSPKKYNYAIFVNVPDCAHNPVRVGRSQDEQLVDPDVWNQPQP